MPEHSESEELDSLESEDQEKELLEEEQFYSPRELLHLNSEEPVLPTLEDLDISEESLLIKREHSD